MRWPMPATLRSPTTPAGADGSAAFAMSLGHSERRLVEAAAADSTADEDILDHRSRLGSGEH